MRRKRRNGKRMRSSQKGKRRWGRRRERQRTRVKSVKWRTKKGKEEEGIQRHRKMMRRWW